MNQIFKNILKTIGVLALSAAIYFMFEPQQEVQNQAVNLALEFLGKKLLAMVPEGHEQEIETRFEAVREQALKGEINDERLQEFTTIVLNAQAEGQPLELAKIDSALVALHETEALVAADQAQQLTEAQRLAEWAQRMHEFERFEKRWQTLMPDSNVAPAAHEVRRVRPHYRISKQFVVQVDSAALANAIGFTYAFHSDSLPPHAIAGQVPPPPHVRTIIRQLEGEQRELRVELHAGMFEQQKRWADSLRARAQEIARERRGIMSAVPPLTPIPPTTETMPPPKKN